MKTRQGVEKLMGDVWEITREPRNLLMEGFGLQVEGWTVSIPLKMLKVNGCQSHVEYGGPIRNQLIRSETIDFDVSNQVSSFNFMKICWLKRLE